MGEAALQLSAVLSHTHNYERARGVLERCMREQQPPQGAAAGPLLRLRALLGCVVLAQQLAEPPGERDRQEIEAAAVLFEAALAQDATDLEVRALPRFVRGVGWLCASPSTACRANASCRADNWICSG